MQQPAAAGVVCAQHPKPWPGHDAQQPGNAASHLHTQHVDRLHLVQVWDTTAHGATGFLLLMSCGAFQYIGFLGLLQGGACLVFGHGYGYLSCHRHQILEFPGHIQLAVHQSLLPI